MTVRELREKYVAFFETKGHRRFPSGSLIPYDVTGRLDESLLFNGAGMIQFKPYFRGVAKPDHPRLITCQKCVRTGDIEEVGDATHLTFFEMLGNFSFGDYFKTQAIQYSWEFLTSKEWLGLEPARLSFTVFEIDDEAEKAWKDVGAKHVFRLGEETNYWPAGAFSNGPPGPCGPNSEMFYWTSSDPVPGDGYTREDWIRDDAAGKWVEIWNDVFIQYEWQGEPLDKGYRKTGMPELPFRSIDTGMGLERTAFVLGGYKTVYDTDAFTEIFAEIDRLAQGNEEDGVVSARRIIADHIRTATFCIADGILPGNTGRGYVLRRLIRRAVLKGDRVLGISEPFLYRVYEGVVRAMGHAYPELEERRDLIVETLRNEEILFRRTLKAGTERLEDIFIVRVRKAAAAIEPYNSLASVAAAIAGESKSSPIATHAQIIERLQSIELLEGSPESGIASGLVNWRMAGEDAFTLYDTYGFPLEITKELAAEAGVSVDEEGYERAMREAQARSRGAQDLDTVYGGVDSGEIEGNPEPTEFLGYMLTDAEAKVTAVRRQNGKTYIALDRTPFYAESGGQVGDRGTLSHGGASVDVLETTKSNGIFWHEVSGAFAIGETLQAHVDTARRARIRANHTATHLLHLALRETLGGHATQAGSYVGPDRLRFDFTHGAALTPEQRAKIEARVIELALANNDVTTYVDISPAEAKERGAMALFGEKYGDKVRMVEVGPSKELCGGTHVRTAAEVLPFRILSESSAASGVRRIEAVAGATALDLLAEERAKLQDAASLLKANPGEIVEAVERTLSQLKDERQKRERAERAAVSGAPAAQADVQIGSVKLRVQNFGEIDPKTAASAIDDAVARDTNLVFLAAVVNGDKVQFTAKAGKDAVSAGAHAGNLVKQVAAIAGGGGGGRPDFATAGGRDVSKVDEALAAAKGLVESQTA